MARNIQVRNIQVRNLLASTKYGNVIFSLNGHKHVESPPNLRKICKILAFCSTSVACVSCVPLRLMWSSHTIAFQTDKTIFCSASRSLFYSLNSFSFLLLNWNSWISNETCTEHEHICFARKLTVYTENDRMNKQHRRKAPPNTHCIENEKLRKLALWWKLISQL